MRNHWLDRREFRLLDAALDELFADFDAVTAPRDWLDDGHARRLAEALMIVDAEIQTARRGFGGRCT